MCRHTAPACVYAHHSILPVTLEGACTNSPPRAPVYNPARARWTSIWAPSSSRHTLAETHSTQQLGPSIVKSLPVEDAALMETRVRRHESPPTPPHNTQVSNGNPLFLRETIAQLLAHEHIQVPIYTYIYIYTSLSLSIYIYIYVSS